MIFDFSFENLYILSSLGPGPRSGLGQVQVQVRMIFRMTFRMTFRITYRMTLRKKFLDMGFQVGTRPGVDKVKPKVWFQYSL